jgi:hypothetical protein
MMVGNDQDDRPPRTHDGWMGGAQKATDRVLGRYPEPLPPYTQKGLGAETQAKEEPPKIGIGVGSHVRAAVGLRKEGTVQAVLGNYCDVLLDDYCTLLTFHISDLDLI